jgi:hypothetical protein
MSNLFSDKEGRRGKTVVSLPMWKLYQIVRDRIEYMCVNKGSIDPDAVCQNVGVEVEKAMGIYPNVEKLAPTGHLLKTHPEYWDAIASGDKTFELRKDDRGFKVGDQLALIRFDPVKKKMDESKILFRTVSYILRGRLFGLEEGFVIMGIKDDGAGLESDDA